MIGKKRPQGYPVYVYSPALAKKVYVGTREKLRGEGGALELEREKTAEFHRNPSPKSTLTVDQYAADWLEDHHGLGTRRPADSTFTHNRDMLRPFLAKFGHVEVDGGIGRREALRWAKAHPYNARVVSAMFNDAMNDEECRGNPFARRQQKETRERKFIHPLTEDEVNHLAGIAHRHWGGEGYGWTARAWVLFGAWVGCRPGETFWSVEARDLDFQRGLVTIRRVKKRGNEYPVDVIVFPKAAQAAVLDMERNTGRPLPSEGPVFRSVTGLAMDKGGVHYHWEPIRAAFRETTSDERWAELVDKPRDATRGARQREKNLDFYMLRHFCASVMADRGADMKDIAHQLGNSEQVCRETYVHNFVNRTNDRVRNLLDQPAPVADLDAVRQRRIGGES